MSRGNLRDFNFQSNYYQTSGNTLDSNYSTNIGTFNLLLSYFFIATRSCNSTIPWFEILTHTVSCVANSNCDNSTVETLSGSAKYCKACHYTCLTCTLGALAQNCTACESTYYRLLDPAAHTCDCQPGYIDVGIPLCYPCEYYIAGCNTCLTTSICSLCFPGFTLTLSGICQCTSGFLVTGVCTSVYGCTAATNLAGTIYCTACNTSANFISTANYSCTCALGYTLDANGNCVGTCGDGLLASG